LGEPRDGTGTRFVVLLPRHGLVVRPQPRDATHPHERAQREVFFQLATSFVAETMRTWIVSIMLVDENSEGLQIEAALGLPVDVVREVRHRKGEGVAGVVWSDDRSIHVPDLDADERFRGRRNEVRYPTRSLLSCPIRLDGEIQGVLNVNNRIDGAPFDENDRLLLEALASRLAHALRDFRTYLDGHRTFSGTTTTLRALVDVRRQQVTPLREEVARCGLETARRLDLAEPDLRTLAFALRHYDVGLANVGSGLLRKPDRLSLEERKQVEEHVQHGVEFVARLGESAPLLKTLMHHHENVDGSGYPHGLKGEAIPVGARIVRLVDTLAALLHGDVRREAMSLDAALATLRAGVSRQFCSRVTPLFLEIVEERSDILRAASPADPATGQVQLVAPATTAKLEPVGAGVGEDS
jgi:putative methionine-R-sulfoxide reductase with GAF domain